MLFGRKRYKIDKELLDQRIIKANKSLVSRQAFLENDISSLEKELGILNHTLSEETAKKEQLKKDLRDFNKEYDELEKSYDDIYLSRKAKQKELNSIMTAINGHNLKFKNIESRCEAESKKLEDLKSQLMSTEALKIMTIKECKDAKKSIEVLNEEQNDLQESIKTQTMDNSHIVVSKKSKIEIMNKEIERVSGILEALKTEGIVLAEKNKTIDKELQDKISACNQVIAERESSVSGGTKEASEKLNKLNKSVEQRQRMLFDLESKIDDAKLNGDKYVH